MPGYTGSTVLTAIHPGLTVNTNSGELAVVRRAHYYKNSATAAVIERAAVQRYNSGGVTPADKTEKLKTSSGAARAPIQAWGTAPTTVGKPIVITDCGDKPSHQNSWRPPRPYAGIYLINVDEVGIDANSGANNSTQYSLATSEHDPSLEDRLVRGRRPVRRAGWHFFQQNNTMPKGLTTVPFRTLRTNYVQYLVRPQPRVPQNFASTLFATGGGPLNVNLGLLLETDAFLLMAAQKTALLNELLEADALLAAAARKDAALGLLSSTNALLTAVPLKQALLNQLLESDALLTPSTLKQALLNQLLESDSLLAPSTQKQALLSQLLETDSLLSAAPLKQALLSQLLETDTLIVPSTQKAAALGILSETDTLFSFGGNVITINLGLLLETDSLLVPASTKSALLGQLLETDSLLSPSGQRDVPLGLLSVNHVLLPTAYTKSALLGQLLESDALLSPAAEKVAFLGLLNSTNALLSASAQRRVLLNELIETDALLVVQVTKEMSVLLGLLAETDSLFLVRPPRGLYLTPQGANTLILLEAVKRFP